MKHPSRLNPAFSPVFLNVCVCLRIEYVSIDRKGEAKQDGGAYLVLCVKHTSSFCERRTF